MSESDGFCAAWVLQWATDESARASAEILKADIDERCRQVAENEWQKHNSDDGIGCFSSNPYQKRGDSDKHREQLAEAALKWKAIQNFVTRRICACIDDPVGPVGLVGPVGHKKDHSFTVRKQCEPDCQNSPT